MMKIWIKKVINIPIIIQVSFMNILKISAMKSIKFSVTTIVKMTGRNAGMKKCVKLSNNKYKENKCKTIQNFCKLLWNTFKTVCLDIRCWKT